MADLSLQLQADMLQPEQLASLLVEGPWSPILGRLQTAENILLEGCRGVGKTMLMRTCAERLSEAARNGGRVLGVHTTFKRYLATIPPPQDSSSPELAHFKAWVNARILESLHNQVERTFGTSGKKALVTIANVQWTNVVAALETTYAGRGTVASALRMAGLDDPTFHALQGYTYTSERLQEVRRRLNLDLMVLLLDDAAHALDTRAQGAFFTLVKSLYAPGLAFKIAVYPGVTRYGVDFSYGHDAVVVELGQIPGLANVSALIDIVARRAEYRETDEELPDSRSAAILIKRLLEDHRNWLELLVYCANGNPRSLIKLLAQLQTGLGERAPADVRYEDVRNAVNFVTDRHLDNMIPGVIKDLDPRLVRAAEELLERFRDKFRDQPGPLEGDKPRMYLALSNAMQIPYLCMAARRLLVAANVLSYNGPQRLSNRENGGAFLLHPGFVFRDNVLAGGVSAERWLQHFSSMSPRVHAEVTRSAALWLEVREAAMSEPGSRCVNGHPLMDAASMCEECGARAAVRGPAAITLEKPIDVLELSDRIKERLRAAGMLTVRQVFEATEDQLDRIPYIGETRARMIKSAVGAAVDEFLGG
ncbi:MAG TPA: hypothetical protein VF493_01525 [Terriglobales bacterium]